MGDRPPPSTFKQIQCMLSGKTGDQVNGLRTLSQLLSYNWKESFGNFSETITLELLNILMTSNDSNLTDPASLCIFLTLEKHPQSVSSLFNYNGVAVLAAKLLEISSVQTSENCIRALDIVSKYRNAELGRLIGIEPFLKGINLFSTNEQAAAVKTVVRITNAFVEDKFSSDLPIIVGLTTKSNLKIAKNACIALNNISSRVPAKSVPKEVIGMICTAISQTNESDILSHLLGSLVNLSVRRVHIESIILSKLDFDRILFGKNIQNNTTDFQRRVFKLFNNLLPCPKLPEQFVFPKHRRPPEAKNFAITIQNEIIKTITTRPLCPKYMLLSFAATQSIQQVEMSEPLMASLLSLSEIKALAPYVLAVLVHFENITMIAESGIAKNLSAYTIDEPLKAWYQRTLPKLTRRISKEYNERHFEGIGNIGIKEILDLIQRENVSPFVFLSSGLVDRCISILESRPENDEYLEALQKYTLSILSFLHPAQFSEISTSDTLSRLAQKDVFLTVITPQREQVQVKISMFDTLASIEGWYNGNWRGYNAQRLQQSISANPELAGLVEVSFEKTPTMSMLSNLFRAFNGDSYPRLHVYMRASDQMYSNCDSVFTALCDAAETPQNLFDMRLLFELLDGDLEQSPPLLKKETESKATKVMELLMRIHFYTKKEARSAEFSERVLTMLAEPLGSIGRFSTVMSIVFNYPFLFELDIRLLWLKLTSFDPISAIHCFSRAFDGGSVGALPSQETIRIKPHRDSLFTDGVLITRHLMRNKARLDVCFAGEREAGVGPTREFFTLFSGELCDPRRGLFRSEVGGKRCRCENGLFVSPGAKPVMLEVLGKLVAKAISLECLLDIDFNPAFFSFVRGNAVSVEEVDPMLGRSLATKEGFFGHPFTYPGLPQIELCEGGRDRIVDEESVDEFVGLVESFTCGEHLRDHADAFRKGFSSIIPWTSLEIFSEEEICRIISGDAPLIGREELEQYTTVGVGYSADSPQVGMFFDVVSQLDGEEQRLFVQFVTGMRSLPYGGLKNLDPPLTLVRLFPGDDAAADTLLPLSNTCASQVKLPEYSDVEIMRAKLLTAITESPITFNI